MNNALIANGFVIATGNGTATVPYHAYFHSSPHQRLEPAKGLDIAEQVANALEAAHAAGIMRVFISAMN